MKVPSLFQRKCPVRLTVLLILSLAPLTGLFAEEPSQPKNQENKVNAQLEVMKTKLNGYFIDIRLRIHGRPGSHKVSEDYPKNVYVIEESTGEKFFARRIRGIGTLGQRNLQEGFISSVRIENVGMKIKKNSRITVVVEDMRQEHVVVEE